MCVIIQLLPGVMVPEEKLYNAVWNNPDGWGIISRKDGKAKVIRGYTEEGTDPKTVQDHLEKLKDTERFLHVRNRTDGTLGIDNTQPFEVLNTKERQVYFMHNGVLGDFKPSTVNNIKTCKHYLEPDRLDLQEYSDSARFVELVLKPLSKKMDFDFDDPIFINLINNFWATYGNRGLLVANEGSPLFLNPGDWKVFDGEGGKYRASNDSYFDKLTRGPEFRRREEERKKREEEEKAKNQTLVTAREAAEKRYPNLFGKKEGVTVVDNEVFNQKCRINKSALGDFWEDYEIWNPEGYRALGALTSKEVDDLICKMLGIEVDDLKSEDLPSSVKVDTSRILEVSTLFSVFTSYLTEETLKSEKLQEKLDKASQRIENLVKINANLQMGKRNRTGNEQINEEIGSSEKVVPQPTGKSEVPSDPEGAKERKVG